VISSWTTDAPGGFSDAAVEVLAGIMPPLTLVFMLRAMNQAARTLLTTYLGTDAAERVLAGNIVRGRAESIRAVVWFSDLVGFTRISDKVGPEGVLALLNDYAEAQLAMHRHRGATCSNSSATACSPSSTAPRRGPPARSRWTP
jgi:adenylate cyclase